MQREPAGPRNKRKSKMSRANAAIASVPDFALTLVFSDDADQAAALFAPDECVAGADPAARFAVAARRLADREPAALVAPSNADPEIEREARRIARAAHAPFAAVILGAATPPGVKDPIRLDPSAAMLARPPLACDRRGEPGPFDIIGDVHGCFEELVALLETLGWRVDPRSSGEALFSATPPPGRRAIFVGDLTDRGPLPVEALRLVMGMVEGGVAEIVSGNHDHKLMRMLSGADVTRNHGLAETEAALARCSEGFRARLRVFLEGLPDHLWLDDGRLVIAHAGLMDDMHGRAGKEVRKFALFGDVTGERDAYGLPVRLDWAARYAGAAAVIYGHTPTLATVWRNNTLCVDSGCCFGGRLTAARWPEREIVAVPALRQYSKPIKPLPGA